jgi:hypothetical protein
VRLTLRTLLAYLDDTLPSIEIKQIGEKVAESDAAQELIARIKQVTRRRRLTTPPASGPMAFEPNDVAEYLDNALPSDQVSELEKQCLESDVHLAEIAACHQILTLVLGEPALVPPTARERMYGLVKGRESIPYRKASPTKKGGHDGLGDEEAMELSGGWMRWVLPVAGVLLIVALGLAVSQVLPKRKDDGPSSKGLQAKNFNGAAAGDRGKANGASDKDRADDGKGKGAGTTGGADKDRGKGDDRATGKGKDGDAKGNEVQPPVSGRRAPPSQEPVVLARYAGSGDDALPGVLVRRKAGATGPDAWEKVPRNGNVQSTDTLMSLPGLTSLIRTNSGVGLLLRGNVREFALAQPQLFLLESAVVLHKSKEVDLDLTLLRGRIYLTNQKDGEARVRIRFGDQVWEVGLASSGAQVGMEYHTVYSHDINHRAGEEPRGFLVLMLIRGEATITVNDVDTHTRTAKPPRAYLVGWDSFRRATDPVEYPELPASWRKTPPTAEDVSGDRLAYIKRMSKALKELEVRLNASKPVNIAVKEGLGETDPVSRVLSIYCQGAIDDVGNLVDEMGDEDPTHQPDRRAAIFTLRRWLSRRAGQDRVLYDEKTGSGILLDKKYKSSEARRIHALLFDLPIETWNEPETFELLANCTRSPKVAIAELGYSHLLELSRGVKMPSFNAADSVEDRKRFAAAIDDMIAKKRLPPNVRGRETPARPKPKPDDE